MGNQKISVIRKCRTCQGSGEVDDWHCETCGQRIADDDPWWATGEEIMPCGHFGTDYLIESATCPECQGMGVSEQWVSQREWRVIQLGWLARYAFVGLAILIPVFVFAFIVGRERSDPYCGNWWFGLMLPLLVVYRPKSKRESFSGWLKRTN